MCKCTRVYYDLLEVCSCKGNNIGIDNGVGIVIESGVIFVN